MPSKSSPPTDYSPGLSPLARRLIIENQSPGFALDALARERLAAGEELLMLTLGDPVDPPHPAIIDATSRALAEGRTHYSLPLGEPTLRAAVAAHEGVKPDNVAILPGAQAAGCAAICMVAGDGDEVILSNPHYATYPAILAASGATPALAPVRDDLGFNLDAIAGAITPRTRAIFLASPSNPTGAALELEDYAILSALCRQHGLWLVIDEVYANFRHDGKNIRAWEHGPAGRTIVTCSLSKSHAMPGYRIGWLLAPEPVITAMAGWLKASLFGVSQFVQDSAIAALALPPAELAPYLQGFAARARQVVEQASTITGLSARMPAGGMFVMVDIRAIMADDQLFARRLLDEYQVAVNPGSIFGDGAAGHIRISLTPDSATLTEAMARIARLVDTIRAEQQA